MHVLRNGIRLAKEKAGFRIYMDVTAEAISLVQTRAEAERFRDNVVKELKEALEEASARRGLSHFRAERKEESWE